MAVSSPVRIEAMTLDDVPAVHEIERLSFRTPWPAYAFEQELRGNRLARYVVARIGATVAGFAGVWLMVDDAHVTTFGVHPDWRRQGVGRRMLLALSDVAADLGARRMTLEVRASNVAAQALYRAFGFEIVGRRPRYYTDDGEDALVMTTPDLGSSTFDARLSAERKRADGCVER
jgi:[ribosomal protein S18]-alanine N-acetyltransferase